MNLARMRHVSRCRALSRRGRPREGRAYALAIAGEKAWSAMIDGRVWTAPEPWTTPTARDVAPDPENFATASVRGPGSSS